MPGRKIRDERDALDCLDRYERSGLDFRDWVRLHEVDGRSLHCWKLSLEKKRPRPLRLVELVPDRPPASKPTAYLIRCGEFAVEVGGDFDQETLARILEVVAAC